MSSITFEPTGARAGWTFSLEGEPPKGCELDRPDEGIAWAVKLNRGQTVRLATGEKLRDLPGRVRVRIGDATPHGMTRYAGAIRWGRLTYHGAVESRDGLMNFPESYDLDLHVSQALFERVRALLAIGKIPSLDVEVGSERARALRLGDVPAPDEDVIKWEPFGPDDAPAPDEDEDAIKCGWEPDGSGLEWDNKKHQRLQVLWCRRRRNTLGCFFRGIELLT